MRTNLFIGHNESLWALRSWAEFSSMENRDKRVVILPVTGMSDWSLGAPLDFEECLTLSILQCALQNSPDPKRFIVVPPIRFCLGRRDQSFFSLDPETAHAFIEEVVASIHSHGFRKIVFLNSSPLNEDLVDAAGRDLRIQLGVQPFCINLRGIGLDLQSPEHRDKLLAIRDALFSPESGDEQGKALLESAGKDLLSLLDEVYTFAPLRNEGRIPTKTYPL